LILIFVFDFFVGKKLSMRRNNEVSCSSRGRTIRPIKVTIARAAFTRGNGNGARGSRGGRGAAVAPWGGRGAALTPRGQKGAVTAPRWWRGAVTVPRGRGAATPQRRKSKNTRVFFLRKRGCHSSKMMHMGVMKRRKVIMKGMRRRM
jgi:hypothetical protein